MQVGSMLMLLCTVGFNSKKKKKKTIEVKVKDRNRVSFRDKVVD